ncbi:MAG TPA: hypothetical protein VMU94_02600 [Streptosporangiaceae bacterium]|nr:hypothetical protein [Streptosporangiaceae bacterium]
MTIRTLTAALAASAAVTLAACGSSGTAGNSPSSTPGARTPAAPSQPRDTDVCTALPMAVASQITGTTFTSTKSSSVAGMIFSCEYRGPGTALLQISVQTKDGKQAFGTDVTVLKTVNHPPVLVSGVGDEAFSEPDPNGNAGSAGASGFASYGAVFGDTYIKIGGLTYVTAGQGRQIAERLHGKF